MPQPAEPLPTPPRRRKRLLLLLLALILLAITIPFARPAAHLAIVRWYDTDTRQALAPGTIDDASRLNATPVQTLIDIPQNPAEAETQLKALVLRAKKENLRIAIAGTRHSMGGHTIYPGGIALNMLPFNALSLDKSKNILRAGSGARWSDILPHLDAHSLSIDVMQSFSDFSVGGTLSVNAHGWTYAAPPIASSVESLRLLTADGNILRCSRTENPELFAAALGGYGLFGIILDAELRLVPNARYRSTRTVMPAKDLVTTLRTLPTTPAMAFARLSIAPSSFMEEAVLTTFYPDPGPIPALLPQATPQTVRTFYRGAQGSDYGKELRWQAEKWRDEELGQTHFSRNQLLHAPFAAFENRTAATTDILQEYFLPPDQFHDFILQLKTIVRSHHADLINATVRDIRKDDTTLLRYADQDMLAIVLLFVQPRTPAGEADMQSLTRNLIDAALARKGRYYLPYRLHATPQQFRAAYPMAETFFTLKRQHDPNEIFQNQFYHHYAPNP